MEEKVLIVTGSSGRIGSKVLERFKGEYRLVGLDFVPPKDQNIDYEYFKVDVGSDDSVKSVMKEVKEKVGGQVASFVHLAAYYNFTGGEWEMYENITVKGTSRLLKAAEDFHLEQFLFSSTMLVHAPKESGPPIKESDPLVPSWEYPRSKILTEKEINASTAYPTVILRIAGVYDDYCNSIPLSNQIQRIYENQLVSHLFPGDIHHGTSFLHMDDLVESIYLSVKNRAQLPMHDTFLIGEETVLSTDDLQRGFSQLIRGKEMTTYKIPKWFAKLGAWAQNHIPFMPPSFIKPWMIDFADDNYHLDTSHAKGSLGWSAKKGLQDTMPLMIQALNEDPAAWYQHHNLEMPHWLKKKQKAIR